MSTLLSGLVRGMNIAHNYVGTGTNIERLHVFGCGRKPSEHT